MESTEREGASEYALSRYPAASDHSPAGGWLVPSVAGGVSAALVLTCVALEVYQGDGLVMIGSHTQSYYQVFLTVGAVMAGAVAFVGVLRRAMDAGVFGAKFWTPVVTVAAWVGCTILLMLMPLVALFTDLGEYTRLSGPPGANDYTVRVGSGLGQWPVRLYHSTGWLRYEELDVPLVMTGSPHTFSDGDYTVRLDDGRLVLEYPPASGNEHVPRQQVLLPNS